MEVAKEGDLAPGVKEEMSKSVLVEVENRALEEAALEVWEVSSAWEEAVKVAVVGMAL